MGLTKYELKEFLDAKVEEFNTTDFIAPDPISVPHRYTLKEDIEIASFLASTIAWGNRKMITKNGHSMMDLLGNSPYDFVMSHEEYQLERLEGFVHRTFNDTDLLYVIEFFKQHYTNQTSLETAFFKHQVTGEKIKNVEMALTHFHEYFFSIEDAPHRTKKHIANPVSGSTCKRLNMYLRWMIRNDQQGVDFGIWKSIKPAELICPVDVHVARVARSLGMIKRKQTDWLTALELTNYCRTLDSKDPVKYDFALFSLGVIEKFN